MENGKGQKDKIALIGPALFLLAMLVYGNTLVNGFAYDDTTFVTGRESIRNLENIPSYFTTDARGLYRPLRTTLYAVCWSLFKDWAPGWHFAAMLLHALATLLLYHIARYHVGRSAALLAGLLFAVHPVHSEKVAFITAGMDTFGTVLMFAAWLCAIKAGIFEKGGKLKSGWVIAGLGLFAASMFGNEESILLPGYLTIVFFWLWRKSGVSPPKTAWFAVGATLLMSAGFMALRTAVLGGVGRTAAYAGGTFSVTFYAMGKVLLRYFQLLLFPTGLRAEYGYIAAPPSVDLVPLIGWAVTSALIGAAFYLLWKGRNEGLGLSLMLAAFLPSMNLIPTPELIAERYVFIPSAGYCIFAGVLVAGLIKPESTISVGSKKLVLLGFLALAGVFAMMTIAHNRVWKDDCTLFTDNLRHSPNSSVVHNNLGGCLQTKGELNKAIHHFEQAAKLDPQNSKGVYNLINVLRESGRAEQALAVARTYVKDCNKPSNLLFVSGVVSAMEDDDLSAQIQCLSESPDYLAGAGSYYCQQKRFDNAAPYLKRALGYQSLDPKYRKFSEMCLKQAEAN